MGGQSNGMKSERESKKRKQSAHSSDEEDGSYSPYISEEHYRTMLGDHIQKYKRRLKNSSPSPASNRPKSSLGVKDKKLSNEQRGKLQRLDPAADFFNDSHTSKNFRGSDSVPKYATDRFV